MNELDTGLHYPLKLDNLPQNWKVGYVGNYVNEIQPGFASGKHNKEGAGIPHIRPFNIDRQGKLDLAEIKSVAPETDNKRLRINDVLFNNTNSPELIGKTTVISSPGDWGFSNHMTRLRFNDDVVPKFAAYQLHFLWMTGYYLHNCVKHVNQASISSKTLANRVPFVAPPTDQQLHIVSEIEKQFSRLDEAVANYKRAKANLKRYKAAILKAAVEGGLVETEASIARREGRDYETGKQLLQRILETRRSRWQGKGKYKEPAAPDTAGLPRLSEGWIWVTMDQIVKNYDGTRVPVRSQDRENRQGSYPYYGASGVIDHVDDYLFDGNYLLIAEDGANLLSRNTPIAFQASGQFWVNNHAHIVQTVCEIPLAFLEHYLNSKDLTQYITGSAQPKLTQAAMNKIPVPLPSIAEQQRIVAEVERHLSVIRETEVQLENTKKRSERLRQSVLVIAFSGQLAPEYPNAGLASVLLKRIQADRVQKKHREDTEAPLEKLTTQEITVTGLIEALKNAGDWIRAQEAFRRCGAGDGVDTDIIERLYAELRDHVRPGIIEVERRGEEDWLRVSPSKRT